MPSCVTCSQFRILSYTIECMSWNGAAFLKDGICSFNPHQYIDYSVREFFSCHDMCEACEGPSENDCTSCFGDYVNIHGTCISPNSCRSNQIFDYNNGCRDCDTSCATCSGTSSYQCLTCNPPYQFYLGACKIPPTCLEGQYINEYGECQQCYKTCKTCHGSNFDQCTSCDPPRRNDYGQCELDPKYWIQKFDASNLESKQDLINFIELN